MPPANPVVVTAAVEGLVEEAVLGRLVSHVGALLGPVHGKNGKDHLQRGLRGYNAAAQRSRWVVLVDLNQQQECAPPLRAQWLPQPARLMCFRVVVREIESWLLADRERIAHFLGISAAHVPAEPENIADPKQAMVELAKRSRRRDIQEDMVPRPRSGREVGPAYTSRLLEFVENQWRPDVAAQRAASLRRCVARLHELVRAKA